jgi:hypothetical protein
MERNAGNSSHDTLVKIASAIGVSLLFMLDVDNESYKEEEKNNP